MGVDLTALQKVVHRLAPGPLKKQVRWVSDTLTISTLFDSAAGPPPELQRRLAESRRRLLELIPELEAALPGDADIAVLKDSLRESSTDGNPRTNI